MSNARNTRTGRNAFKAIKPRGKVSQTQHKAFQMLNDAYSPLQILMRGSEDLKERPL